MMLSAPPGEAVSRTTHERTIEVTNTSILSSGTARGGRRWTLFTIDANDEQGSPITEPLRSFQNITPGTRRCAFEDYKGEAWTLREIDPVGVVRARRNEARAKVTGQPAAPTRNARDAMVTNDELEVEFAALRERVTNLEGRLELLASLLGANT